MATAHIDLESATTVYYYPPEEEEEGEHLSHSPVYAAVEMKVNLAGKVCRICQLSLAEEGDGDPMELGCCCKDDLGAAHTNCAETWFNIKGNKICEICNCTAHNVEVGGNENTDDTEHSNDNANAAMESTGIAASSESQGFWQGQTFLNSLLACMVFAFVISWLFHFKLPSYN